MRQRMELWSVMCLVMAVAGCMPWTRAEPSIYQDDSLTVRLESNPAVEGQTQASKAAQAVTPQQLAAAFRGLYVSRKTGFAQSVIGSSSEPVFNEGELPLVARELQHAFRLASDQERAAFRLFRVGAKGVREETDGAVSMKGSLLYVTLTKFRYSSRVSYYDAQYASGFDFELFYEPADAVVPSQKGFAARWMGSDQPSIIIDTQRFRDDTPPVLPAAAAEPPGPTPSNVRPATAQVRAVSPSMDSDMVQKLQQQVKELTDSNQELRAKLSDMRDRQDRSQAVNEERARLRQDLAEAKQLLADKVLELNRLKNKPSGTGKGKK
ncbi:MAG: hypothetical protein HY976_01395 [Candidatus Kerfeldbacteria bacterium]|nr:hypothetical protein [Candidatus Kerfeldbacteria bacterium]